MLQSNNGVIMKERGISRDTALGLTKRKGTDLFDLFTLTNRLREKYYGNNVDLCSIINAKSGACPEDCSFCAQSAYSKTNASVYPLLEKDKIIDAAMAAKRNGVKRFCIVTSGKNPSKKEMPGICEYISEVRKMGLLPCATLGMMDKGELRQLQEAGLHRYHHNLETSESFFSEICNTHTYENKINTIMAAKSLGLSVCSGGIFGLGESWEDRIDMAFAIKELSIDSVPINFLTPVRGTPMGGRDLLNPLEALKIVAMYRLILPACEIRVCGGRHNTLRDLGSQIFISGANGLLIGNYLTTSGREPEEDLQMINDLGMEV
jgi:biotin synthase